jgi:predicted Zn-dependent protease
MMDHDDSHSPAATDALHEALSLYELAARHYEHAELPECEELLRTALLRFPNDGRFIQLQGLLWHAQRRYSSACRAFEIASLLVPLSHAAQLAQADVYRRCGRNDDARTILSFLVTRSDLPAILLPGLTAALGLIGEYQQALEVCRDASQRDPEQDQALYAMAYYMNKLDYPLECIVPLLRRAMSLAPDSRLYRISLAVLCARSGRWHEAYTLFAPLSPGELKCQTCVRFMARVFDHQGDTTRRNAALARLEQLAHDRQRLAAGTPAPQARGLAPQGRGPAPQGRGE